jgi:hypothetical protein
MNKDSYQKIKEEFNKVFPEFTAGCTTDNGQFLKIGCVWDLNTPYSCELAAKGIKKENCEYWKADAIDLTYVSRKRVWQFIEYVIGQINKPIV